MQSAEIEFLFFFAEFQQSDIEILCCDYDQIQFLWTEDSSDRTLHLQHLEYLQSLVIPNSQLLLLELPNNQDIALLCQPHVVDLLPPKHNHLSLLLKCSVPLRQRDDLALCSHRKNQPILPIEEQLLDFSLVSLPAPLQVAIGIVLEDFALGIADHESISKLSGR